tara:strand:- start:1592 stop:2125 length:534 start_codon:yes stop_codon:yes gene_type:complete
METVDNILIEKDLFNLYTNLISSPVWDLHRTSLLPTDDGPFDMGCFPGFIVKDRDKIYNHFWHGYFASLFERINVKFFEENKYYLPRNIIRINLGAKNETSLTEFHIDDKNPGVYTILGFLTPIWAKDWGGHLQVEDKKIDYKPGRFMIFKSDSIHNGVGPSQKIPYWRISINYLVQ